MFSAPRRLLLLLAAAAGLGAANLYYAQPLAARMAESLQTTAAAVGAALVATQLGYALGMILLVPLGDGRERRGVIVTTVASAVPALLLVSIAPSVELLAVASLLVGLASSVPQMIVPFAVGLGPPEERGKLVGTVMAGLLAGILLSRTVSGALAAVLGWRAVFVCAAGVMAVLALTLRLALPRREPDARLRYGELLRSLGTVLREEPVLRQRALVGAAGFASFSVFWSMLSFQLAAHGHGSATAGIFGVLGLVGVLVAPVAGRLAVGGRPARLNALALLVSAASFAVLYWGGGSLVAIALGVVLLDAGSQANLLTNQTVLYGLNPGLRSRINALYMVAYFAGGALGTASASMAWSIGRWPLVCAVGAAFSLAGIVPLRRELK
jgi:predicted MFS family arabinose efflux permease